jgi:tRNA threonylcarbamoyladenosine biosynthesis protein TsaE
MATFISNSPAETEALAESWGRSAKPGLVVALSGDLGAGKTQLVKGFARGLGITERIHSPTFALVNIYTSGRLTCFHLDLYRLETPQQIASAGIEQYLRSEGVTLIEWAERLWPQLRQDSTIELSTVLRFVRLTELSETCRRIDYEDPGA